MYNLQLAMELVDEARNTAEDAKAGTMSGWDFSSAEAIKSANIIGHDADVRDTPLETLAQRVENAVELSSLLVSDPCWGRSGRSKGPQFNRGYLI